LGLALIAAAAAANPAASISLLIAALASLSTVALPDDLEEPEELLREDLAIASSPLARSRKKTLQSCNGSRMIGGCAGDGQFSDMLKGTAAQRCGALRHGQRPKVWPFVSI
jgi:hypothetical protein